MKNDPKNLNVNLKRLAEITEWFDDREEIDVEEWKGIDRYSGFAILKVVNPTAFLRFGGRRQFFNL